MAQSLLSLLPPVLHVPADPVAGTRVATVLSLLARELGTRGAGARAAVGRLIDLLLILAVRAWSARAAEETPSLLRALNDPLIAHALAAVRDRPDHPWTIESPAARSISPRHPRTPVHRARR